MFGNLNWTNVVILLLLALFIFGDRLPGIISDGMRMLRNLRRMAQDATGDLSRELGTDVRLEDLHPKSFVRKHLLSEADQEALLAPVKGASEDVLGQARGVERDLRDVGRRTERVTGDVKNAAQPRRSRTSSGSTSGRGSTDGRGSTSGRGSADGRDSAPGKGESGSHPQAVVDDAAADEAGAAASGQAAPPARYDELI